MIKFDDNAIYLSGGEACYIVSVADGRLKHMYFGKRTEPEDDIAALGVNAGVPEIEVSLASGGKTVACDLRLVRAELVPNKPILPHTLAGGKTLVVELADEKHGVKARLFYTAYARGGFTRRAEVDADGRAAAVTLCLCADGVATETGMRHLVTVERGEACAYCMCPFADGQVRAVDQGGQVRVDSTGGAEELLLYSDNGSGGATRVLHDVLREYGKTGATHARAALFLPKMKIEKARTALKAACELGFDVAAVNESAYGDGDITELAAQSRAVGIRLGLRIEADGDIERVKRFIAAGATSYVLISSADTDFTAALARVLAVREGLLACGEDVEADCALACADDRMRRSMLPQSVRNIITPAPAQSFKQRFDVATTGSLGYEFDPAALSDGVKRAVRAQILSYQDDAPTVMNGDMYDIDGGVMFVTKDKSKAYAVTTAARVKLVGLDEHNLYHVREAGKTFSGAALCGCGIALPCGTLHLRQVADWVN